MPTYRPGRHELGQNFLRDRATIARIVDLVRERPGPLVEWGTGNGAITLPLATLGRPLEGIEIDAKRARVLGRRVGSHVCISAGDILRHAPPAGSVVVCNVPFHLTTPILRHLLASTSWHSAILITQWEVARKRAGVGGATQLTAQCWPWFDFTLDRRIPADAFTPRPSVDAGLLLVARRVEPLVPWSQRRAYQDWVGRVFGSRGRGLTDMLRRNGVPAGTANDLANEFGLRRVPLPRDLRADEWATAFAASRSRALVR
jgi:23S rRNA (adenine-N6)-dimethyltransferase